MKTCDKLWYFNFINPTKNCTLVASQPLFFRASRHFANDIAPLAETCSKPQKRWRFFFGEKKCGTDGRKAQSLTQKNWGETGNPWVFFLFGKSASFHGSSWLLVYIPESHENLQRIFARPFSRRSKKSSAKLWQLGVGQWQWLTPPQKKKTPPVCLEVRYNIYMYI